MGEFFKTYNSGGSPATGAYRAPNVTDQAKQLYNAYSQYLPQFAGATQSNTEALTPRQNQLDYSQYSQFAPLFSQVGNDLQNQEVGNNLSMLQGHGQDLIKAAQSAEDLASPDYAKSRTAANQGFQSLIGGMDPNKLSGAELANTERGINRLNARTGNLNTGDATTTAANAMTFGGALDQKRQNFGQALNLFPGIAGASKSNLDTFSIGTGKGAANNAGLQQYAGPQTKFDAGANSLQSTLATGQQNQYNLLAGRPTQSQAYKDISGSSCYGCYIFKEVYGYPDAPSYIRWCRDFFYARDPKIAKGYRKMSYWLVPLMQQSRIVRYLATGVSIMPLSYYGQYLTGQSKWKVVFKPIAKFWLKYWSLTGK